MLGKGLVAVLAALAMVAASAPGAQAIGLVRSATALTFTGTTSASDSLTVSTNATTVVYTPGGIEGYGAKQSWGALPAGCTQDGTTRVVTCTATNEELVFNFLAGGDTLIYGGARRVVVDGGDQNDTIYGGTGNDEIHGGNGIDTIVGGAGGDKLDGGPGSDALNFSDRTVPITVTLDGVADDGEPGEGDDITGFETIVGGQAGDLLQAGSAGVTLQGGDGNDRIVGGPSVDTLFGEKGDDDIEAIGGGADLINCGEGTADGVAADSSDTVDACERTDSDGDQALTPEDCDDHDPARHPGATDVPGNGIDEDCSGADATPLDSGGGSGSGGSGGGSGSGSGSGDGSGSGGGSGSGSSGGDGSGGDAGSTAKRIAIGLHLLATPDRHTRVSAIRLKNVPAGAVVQLRCAGSGCPKARLRQLVARKATLRLDTRAIRQLRLTRGQRLEIVVRLGKQVVARLRATITRPGLAKRWRLV